MNERLLATPPYPMVTLARRKEELRARGRRVFDFGTGDPIEPTPPAIREAFENGVPAISQYPPVTGLPAMRRAAAGYLRERFGVGVDPDRELLPTQGSKEAIFHLPMTVVDPSREKRVVLYGVPAYPVFELGARFAEAEVHELPLGPDNGYLLDPAAVEPGLLRRTALVFLNYPHNPSGTLMPAPLFEAWVAAAREHDFLLVSDECYVDLWYGDEVPRSVLQSGRDNVLAVHSLSKRSGMTGYRSGFVAGDARWIGHYQRFRSGMGVAPTEPVQRAAAVAWADTGHVAERRALFAAKRRVLVERFADLGLEVWPGPATLFLWVRTPVGTGDVEYVERLLEAGIVASPGSFFGPGQEGFFRLALVPGLDDCRAAAAAWPQ